MKKIYTLMTLVACTMMFAGCQKDSLIFDAEIENYASDSKVYIDANNYACWNHGDPITINSTPAYVMIDDVAKTASVSVETTDLPSGVTGFTAVYPSNNVDVCADGHVSMDFPQTQVYKVNRGAQVISAPMVAYAASTEDPLKFRNTGSLLAVTVPYSAEIGAMEISEIRVTSNSSALSGRAEITVDDPENPVMTVDGIQEVKLTFPKDPSNLDPNYNKILSGSKTFYIAIPQITNTRLYVNVVYAATKNGAKSFHRFQSTLSNVVTIERNKIVPISIDYSKGNNKSGVEVLFGTGLVSDPYTINTASDLMLLASVEEFPAGKIYSQRADITLPANFTGIGSTTNPFKGEYRGRNLKIINNSSASIFNAVGENSKIGNLVVENRINATAAQNISGLVGEVNGNNVKIEMCEVSGSLNVSNASAAYSVGGILGLFNGSNLTINKCNNTMNITCASPLSTVGGIMGMCTGGKVEFVESNNNSTIKGGKVGGIIGETNSSNLLVTKSINNGSLSSLQADNTYIGGILGNNKNVAVVCNSANHAELAATAKYVGGLIGNNEGDLSADNNYADGVFGRDVYNFVSVKAGLIGRNTSSAEFKNVYTADWGNVPLNVKWIVGEGDATCINVRRPDTGSLGYDKTGVRHMAGVTVFDIENIDALVADLNAHVTRSTTWKKLQNRAALSFEN